MDGYWGNAKPDAGGELNGSHPLAQGLVGYWLCAEGAGSTATSLVNPRDVLAAGTGSGWRGTAGGVGLDSPATSTLGTRGWVLSTPSAGLVLQPPLTLVWYGVATTGLANGGANPTICTMTANVTNAAPFVGYGLYRPALGNIGFDWNNGTFQSIVVTGAIDTTAYGTPVQYALTLEATAATAYRNGRQLGIDTTSGHLGAITYTVPALCIDRNPSAVATGATGMYTLAVAVYNRRLTALELQQWAAEPYAVLHAPLWRRWFAPLIPGNAKGRRTLSPLGARVGSRQVA